MTEEARTAVPWLRDVSYTPTLTSWARLAARVELIHQWLDANGGDLEPDGMVKPAADHLVRLERAQAQLAARLGMDPRSRAALMRDAALSNAATITAGAELARGRELWAAAEARALAAPPPPPPPDPEPEPVEVEARRVEEGAAPEDFLASRPEVVEDLPAGAESIGPRRAGHLPLDFSS